MEKEIEKDTEEERRWQKERKRRKGEILIYMDASREEEGNVGVAVVMDHDKDEKTRVKRWNLGKQVEVYDGEMFGIWKGIKEGLKRVKRGEGVTITIRSDN